MVLITLPLRLNPAAFRFPPVMLPVALICPVVVILPPITLEVADISPLERKLPAETLPIKVWPVTTKFPTIFPVTFKSPATPTPPATINAPVPALVLTVVLEIVTGSAK